MLIIFLIGVVALVVIAFLTIIFFGMRRYVFLKQRLDKIAQPFAVSGKKTEKHKEDVIVKAYFFIAKSLLQRFNLLTKDTAKEHANRVNRAGFLSKNASIAYLSLQSLSVILLGIIAIVLTFCWSTVENWPFTMKGAFVIFMLWFGFRFPDFVLNRLAKRYRDKLAASILDFLDLFLICIEAGFGNDKALERVTAELALIHPELCQQMRVLLVELRILPDRYAAWENLAARTGLPEIVVMTQIVKQSEALGTSVAQALRTQIDMFRGERLSYIEHKAMRLPTLLTLPLVLFIFPALMLVILGPAIIRAMQIFH